MLPQAVRWQDPRSWCDTWQLANVWWSCFGSGLCVQFPQLGTSSHPSSHHNERVNAIVCLVVSSAVDYYNSVLYGIMAHNIRHLQNVRIHWVASSVVFRTDHQPRSFANNWTGCQSMQKEILLKLQSWHTSSPANPFVIWLSTSFQLVRCVQQVLAFPLFQELRLSLHLRLSGQPLQRSGTTCHVRSDQTLSTASGIYLTRDRLVF